MLQCLLCAGKSKYISFWKKTVVPWFLRVLPIYSRVGYLNIKILDILILIPLLNRASCCGLYASITRWRYQCILSFILSIWWVPSLELEQGKFVFVQSGRAMGIYVYTKFFAVHRNGAWQYLISYVCLRGFLYLQWLESAGARVAVIPFDASDALLNDLLMGIDGVFFTGGG